MDDTRKFVQERFERASLSGNNIDARWARVQFNLRAYAINVRARMLRSIGIDIGSLYLPVEAARARTRMPSNHRSPVRGFGLPWLGCGTNRKYGDFKEAESWW